MVRKIKCLCSLSLVLVGFFSSSCSPLFADIFNQLNCIHHGRNCLAVPSTPAHYLNTFRSVSAANRPGVKFDTIRNAICKLNSIFVAFYSERKANWLSKTE